MIRFYSTFAKTFQSDHCFRIGSLIESCKSMQEIKQTHAQLITTALISHPVLANKLLKLVAFASLSYAHKLFDRIPQPDLFIYNTMIKAHSLSPDSCRDSLVVFRLLTRDTGIFPNRYSFVFSFSACGNGLCVQEGEQVRVHSMKFGLENNVFVVNALIGMYGKWGLVEEGRKVFEWAVDKDLYSWNTMIAACVGSGDMSQAKELFDGMQEQDVVSWSTIIAGYVQVGCFMEALDFFHKMLRVGPKPNEYTLVSALAACSNLVALDQGKWIHVYIGRSEIKMNERLLASIIDMYAKCGEIESASRVFCEHNVKRRVWPWNAMIGGFATHGKPNEAINVFEQMKVEKVSPNKVTFIALLNACSHGYMIEEGKLYFRLMVSDYGINPEIEHYGCMVDLLSRAGLLKEAEDMISSMPMAPDVAIWGALLNACRIYKDMERGYRIGRIIKEMDPNHIGCHVLLGNIYSTSGRWNEARMLREKNEISSDRKKIPGCSSIELKGVFHQFLVGDRSHPQSRELYSFLDEMTTKLKIAGYVPELGELLLDIDDEEDKETALSVHSEKLAIAFGLMNTAPGTPIRIVKNLRVCGDCHQATKFISKVYDRVIIVRDRTRYHHFKDGICSCKDYW
ncbi:pentatricopeptide repeat-containing protein At3g62890-like [Gastrolobium bilobum]|uniref:pentatricopeptide repeat-containing protein At3g62890-like n=1 Tax=Gastrolobium bilobum TaxID=150636 RepID=UPI002AB1E33D|nr:pentatricopeptide repeat-containing protein At3g62890-like [Gastrolobium bilobum]XP_061353531.1 pentatricopeptide repeat-containing protein At3g62890-like [Gastrolobium bilobum]XP_061353532.1 pentatricopeptide repeat-containing protein At3g62890-like [Gastrolobium bilobum]